MDRREATKKTAAVASAVVLPRAIMTAEADREPGVTILTPQRLLSIYDPTLDVSAKPTFMPDGAMEGFVPLPDWLTVHRSHVSAGTDYEAREPHADYELRAKELRVLLDGQPVRGAFEASARDGWVRFMAMRTEGGGKPQPYRHPNGRGAVKGIAFGAVTWMISERALVFPQPKWESVADHKIASIEAKDDEPIVVTLTDNDEFGDTLAFRVPKESPLYSALLEIDRSDSAITVVRRY